MAQFDVYRIESGGLVLDCQSDLLSDLGSRVVAPLRPADDTAVSRTRLNPLIELNQGTYRVATQFVRAVDRRHLGTRVGSAAGQEWEIKAALDMLISGF